MNQSEHGRVLLVDDDDLCRLTLHGLLEEFGFQATCASGPIEADRLLTGHSFDVVLSDIRMPGNGNLEWIERVVRHSPSVPVVLLTGNPELSTAIRAANLPIAAYLVKPPEPDALVAVLRRVIRLRKQQSEFDALIGQIEAITAGSSPDPLEGAVSAELQALRTALAAVRNRAARDLAAPSMDTWRPVVQDAVAVLERTKQHFRSRDLGALRTRLAALLATDCPDAATVSTLSVIAQGKVFVKGVLVAADK